MPTARKRFTRAQNRRRKAPMDEAKPDFVSNAYLAELLVCEADPVVSGGAIARRLCGIGPYLENISSDGQTSPRNASNPPGRAVEFCDADPAQSIHLDIPNEVLKGAQYYRASRTAV